MEKIFQFIANLMVILIEGVMPSSISTPQKCPSVQAIQAVPILVSKKGNTIYTKQIAKFDTDEKWVFIISRFPTNVPEKALKTAVGVLKSLKGSPVPVYKQQETWGNHWYCQYQNEFGYETFAVTIKSKVA